MKHLDDLAPEQFAAIEFIHDGEDSLIAADVGTGKTVIALTAALQDPSVERWLVLAPLLVATDTWANEPAEWKHIMNSAVAIACGNEPQRIAAIQSDAPIVVMNYENLEWLMNTYPRFGKQDTLPFDGLICDEIDKLKSVSSNRFKSFRSRVNKFKKRVGLTGTLIPNDLLELWGQVYMVDGGQSFGKSFYKWRQKYFFPTDYNQYNWVPHSTSRDYFLHVLSDLTFRIKAEGLPQVIFDNPTYLGMTEELAAKYYELEKEYYLELEDEDAAVEAGSAGILAGKLNQLCSGFSYYGPKKKRKVKWHDNRKFEWLRHLYDDICIRQGKQLLVFYHYEAELRKIKKFIPTAYALESGMSIEKRRKYIGYWNHDDIPLLALHPQAAGHGLNLQHSGAHHIAFTTLPWSGGLFHQSTGRLARRGNKAKEVIVHTALYGNTIDEQIYQVLSGRLAAMEDFLDDLESRIGKTY